MNDGETLTPNFKKGDSVQTYLNKSNIISMYEVK